MNVLHIINGLNVGGAEIFLLRLLEGLGHHPMNNTVCSITEQKELLPQFETNGVDVTFLKGKLAAFQGLRKTIRQTKPDVIHAWLYHSILATELARLTWAVPCPVFWGIHHSVQRLELEKPKTRMIIKSLRHFSSKPQGVVYVSQASRAQHENLGFDGAKSITVPNGFDVDRYQPDAVAGNQFRAELGAQPDEFLVGILARYNPVKDYPCFLKGAARLLELGVNARFVLVGRDVTMANEELQTNIQSLGIENRCHVLGERKDVGAILNGLDLLASSSLGEAFPIVVGEAMSCGTPTVVTDVGDSALLVGNRDLVVPSASPFEMAEAWQRVASLTKEQQTKLGQQLRQRVVDKFSLASVSKQYFDLYQSAMQP